MCMADIFSNNTDRAIQRSGMLVARKIGQLGLIRSTNEWHNGCSRRKLTLCIPPPIACVHRAVYYVTFRVREVHWFNIEVRLKWEMCQKELYIFENIAVV